jgi:hypothetical protein
VDANAKSAAAFSSARNGIAGVAFVTRRPHQTFATRRPHPIPTLETEKETKMPLFMFPIGLVLAVIGAIIAILTVVEHSDPSLLVGQAITIRSGWSVEKFSKRYQNNGQEPVQIIPTSDGKMACILTSARSVIDVTDLPPIDKVHQ